MITIPRKFWILTVGEKVYPPFYKVSDVLAHVSMLGVKVFHLQSVAPTRRHKGVH